MKKRVFCALCAALWLLCCCASSFAEESRKEGSGFSSPEEAVMAYAAAWKKGDVAEMLRCYAIESVIDHVNVGAYLQNMASALIRFDDSFRTVPAVGAASRSMLIASRQGALARRLMQGITHLRGMDSNPVMVTAENEAELQGLFAAQETVVPGMPVTEAQVRTLLGDEVTDTWLDRDGRVWEMYYRLYNPEVWGCTDMQEVILQMEINGETALLDMTCVQYPAAEGPAWYLLIPYGYLFECARGSEANVSLGLIFLPQQ